MSEYDEVETTHGYVASAVRAVNNGLSSYCKFLSANDTGDTGTHQAGIYIAKNSTDILFAEPGIRGENKDRQVKITWQDGLTTESRFVYYGVGTRNEYRITRFNRGFPYLRSEHTGDLFVLVKMSEEDYLGYVLSTEDEIDEFLSAFCMGPADTGAMINIKPIMAEAALEEAFVRYIAGLDSDFPSTSAMSFAARTIENDIYNHEADAFQDPDKKLVSWVKMEYQLFKRVEQERYLGIISKGFNTVDAFVETANSILNKRKSRAGKSLENHLAAIFDYNALRYSAHPVTEGKKRPDFIFPSEAAYHTPGYSAEKLVFLGAKTTCKDRWRQVINEANRIHDKHLITLQQGISTQQLDEMEAAGVILVVPRPYIGAYPRERQAKIWTLRKFIEFAKEKTTLC